jgi:TonB family protein
MKKSIILFVAVLAFSSLSTVATETNFSPNTNELLNNRAIKLIIPRYSAEARKARVQGKVLVQVTVNERGRVTEAKTIEGQDLLNEICEKAALASTFKPKTSNGKKVKYSGVIQYTFSITD